MSIASDLLARLRWSVRRRREESEMREEMRLHLEMAADAMQRDGMSASDARRAARLAFGGVAQAEEEVRDAYGTRSIEDLGRDLRLATRVLRRAPGYAAATILTFALGIGAATTIYSLVYGVLARPLPYSEPDRLVVLWSRDAARGKDRNVVSVPDFEAWRDRARSFTGMAALVPAPATLSGDGAPERLVGAEVSPEYFTLLGVSPALGRGFSAEEGSGAAADVVVLSDALWRSRFGGRGDVVGRTLTLDGRPRTVVGVMAPDFVPLRFGWLDDQAFWIPFAATASNRSWGRFLLVVGRLRDGVSYERASAELIDIARQRAAEEPSDRGWSASLMPLARQITGDARPALLVLLGAVTLLLLVATTNVAILALSHARRREYEIAVRRALGASRARLVRQLLVQSAIVGLTGAAVGIAAAWLAVRAAVALVPSDVPRLEAIRLDRPVLLAALAATVAATLAFGVLAAIRGTAPGRPVGASPRTTRRGNAALVVAEVAIAVVLAIGAALAGRSFAALRAVDLGFRAEQAIVARVSLEDVGAGANRTAWAAWSELLRALRATPGVAAVGAISARPLGGSGPATAIRDPLHPLRPGVPAPTADIRWADPGAFQAMRVPVLAGSIPVPRGDTAGIPSVAIGAATARAFWPGTSAVGRRIEIDLFGRIDARVGAVVADVHLADVRSEPRPTIYLPLDRWTNQSMDVVLRGDATAEALTTALRRVVAGVDRSAPVSNVTTLKGLAGESLARDRFSMLVLAAFAVAAMLLAAVGIFGVCAEEVTSRQREIGIRHALGATRRRLVVEGMRRGAASAALGLVIGLGVATLGAQAMRALLFGVGPVDGPTFGGVAVALALVAALATLVPAMRAARVSPREAMRAD